MEKIGSKIKTVAAYDFDDANKGLYASYGNRGGEMDPLSGVLLCDTSNAISKTYILDGFKDADAGLIDFPKDTRKFLREVLQEDLAFLFSGMRDMGCEPILCQPLDGSSKTAESLALMMREVGDAATHIVFRNAHYGNQGQPAENDFFDGDKAHMLDNPARTLKGLGGQVITLPDLVETAKDVMEAVPPLRFREAVDVFAREGQNTYRLRVQGFLRKTDAMWESVLQKIPAVVSGERKPVFIFTADKGGVGKSVGAASCLDYLRYGDKE